MDKDKRIKAEKAKLNKVLENLDKAVYESVQSLVDNAAFMAVTLDDLQVEINETGIISKYQNSATQWGFKRSPAVETYLSMIKQYTVVMKQLAGYLNSRSGEESDGFEEFLQKKWE